ncbi:unnamed protein product [Strongylus vulgaris]|uniref:Uncharacterized protein n=1 Tax=Strongylus vulgaris TaxID=40348 RepID=A0A3P7M1B6_STRVU|nr:unnamed protein product [Strongylus vulgaris]
MNLFTPAAGLFGTHVTWKDIEEDMQRELRTAASFGLNKSAKNIGDNKVNCSIFIHNSSDSLLITRKNHMIQGFLSRIVLIDPDWLQVDKNLPEKFVVKVRYSFPI